MCEECEKAYVSFVWHSDMAPNETPDNIMSSYHPEGGMIQTLNSNLYALKKEIRDEVNAYLSKIFADKSNFKER